MMCYLTMCCSVFVHGGNGRRPNESHSRAPRGHSHGALCRVLSGEQARIHSFIQEMVRFVFKNRCKITFSRCKLNSDDQFCCQSYSKNIF